MAARDPVLLALVALGLLLAPWFLIGPGGTTTSWVVQATLDVLMVYFAWRLTRHPEMTAPGRRFWRVALIAFASCAVGDLYQCLLVLTHPGTTRISLVQTAFVVIGMATVVVATLQHPLGGVGRQRLRLWFDAATVLTGIAVFLWSFLLAEELGGKQDTDRWAASATAVVMLLISFGVLKLILSGTAPFTRFAGAAAALGVAGTALAAPITTGLVGEPGPGLMIVVQLAPCVLTTAAVRLQQLQAGLLAQRMPGELGPRSSRLPYLAVIATQVLLLWSLSGGEMTSRVWGVAAGAVLITALVLGRQQVAFRDNERLLGELRSLHDELRRQATHDALTGLPNRVLLHRRLQESAAGSVSMLLIDLDGFKQVNDEHGHHAGDLVLQAVAERLTGLLGAGEVAARLGGDEFAVLLPGVGADEAAKLAERIAVVVAEPMMIDGHWLAVGASVGVATGEPGEGDGLLREADALMYRRKKARKAGGTALADGPSGLASAHHQRR
ncbi:GGDEF domain-containing protein [Actinoplanes sp. OR16]|uniref:GGDEF domain-containing protein n=1 Tax=Actinoplanes sp. OR16 TaxID=946334 RepID=UPI000FD80FFF|nr:GGDEF domain-containing protein [Actinoplanes sp. OR16]